MKALVTGAGGFLGGAVARLLSARGDTVRSLQRGDYPALVRHGIEVVRGDVADRATVMSATRGVDVVVHVAAKAGLSGPEREYYRTNVIGTENVIATCRANGVTRLVYTSTPSVVFADADLEGVDESTPYATRFAAAYPRTKAAAERAVLAANDGTLATVALRPHLLWGPGDPHLLPRMAARARAGRLRRLGWRTTLVDSIYIDNAAAAHVLAADRIAPGAAIAGRAYFLSQDEPLPLWDLVNRLLDAAGTPRVTKSIPVWAAYALGALYETSYRLLRIRDEPPMTRFLAHQLSTSHWFDIRAARRDLGYEPTVSIDEGMARLAASLRGEKLVTDPAK